MSKSKFIDTNYFYYYNSDIEENVEASLVTVSIQKAQDIQVRDFLGKRLFETIDNLIYDGDGVLTEPYLTLMKDYIAPFTAKWGAYNLMTKLAVRFTNKSMSNKASEWGKPVDITTLNFSRGVFEKEAVGLGSILKEYLDTNAALFPDWNGSCKVNTRSGNSKWGFSSDFSQPDFYPKNNINYNGNDGNFN